MAHKIYLAISALIWLGYGLYCFFAPGSLDEAAGIVARTTTGATEVRAMYGGLQASIGVLCLLALWQPGQIRIALSCVGWLTAGLALGRFAGLFLDDSGTSYTYGALGFEIVCAVGAFALLARLPAGLSGEIDAS